MADAILLLAIPGFLLLIGLELAVTRAGQAQERRMLGYSAADSRTSITMGAVSMVFNGAWRFVEVLILGLFAALVPWELHGWQMWLVALLLLDLFYYWDHRCGHEIR